MKKLLVLLSFFSSLALAAGPALWGPNDTSTMLQKNLNFSDQFSFLSGTADPSSVATTAPKGSLYLRYGGSGGQLFQKQDAGLTTNWGPLPVSHPDGQTFYGDPVNGDDALCDGSLLKKCKTITKLLTFATNPAVQYSLRLAAGNFSGEPTITWPANVNVFGDGTNLNLSFTYTAAPGDNASFVFDGVGVNSFTLDLSAASAALPIFQNGSYNITRTDSTGGAHFVTVRNSTAGNTDLAGSAAYSNILFISSASVQTGGQMLCTNCIFGIGADVYGTGVIQFVASTFVGSITGHTVGIDTPVVKIDASSTLSGSISGATVQYTDQAQYMTNSPSGGVSATTVQAAINELDTEKLASVPQSRTIYVDLDEGDDGTCEVGKIELPCETIGGAESKILDATDTKIYLINIGPGNHDVTGLEAKSNIKWKGQGSAVSSVSVTTGSVDLDNPSMASGQNILAFEGLSFNSAPLVMDAFSIGGTGQTKFFFHECVFNSPQTWTGRADAHDAVQFHDVSFSSTPVSFTSMQAVINSSIMTNDGGDKLYVSSANSAGSVMFIQASVINPVIQVDDGATDDFTLLAIVGSTSIGGLTANGPGSVVYAPGSGFIIDPVMTAGATIQYFRDASLSSYTPAISGNWLSVPSTVKAGLDNLAAYSSSAPTKQMIKALQFSNLASFTAIPLPFAPVGGHEFAENELLLYDAETPGMPGDYTATGVYKFHDNGDATGTLTRAPDWALGATIKKGTLIHVEFNDDSERGTDTWLELSADATVGAGDILPAGYKYIAEADHVFSSGLYKAPVQLFATVDVPLTGLAPGTVVGGLPIADGNSVFLTNQSAPTENGGYSYSAFAQTLSRKADWPLGQVIKDKTLIMVTGGAGADFNGKILAIQSFVVGQSSGPIVFGDVLKDAFGLTAAGVVQLNGAGNFSSSMTVKDSATNDAQDIDLRQFFDLAGNVFLNGVDRTLRNADTDVMIDFSDPDQTVLYPGTVKAVQGVQLATSGSQPTCDVDHRGLMWNLEGGAGVADIYQVCQKTVLDTYAWVTH